MAELVYSKKALKDLERLTDFLSESDPSSAMAALKLIEEAVTVRERHPLIGRAVEPALRELVISHGQSGYVALYSFEQAYDTSLFLRFAISAKRATKLFRDLLRLIPDIRERALLRLARVHMARVQDTSARVRT